MDMSPKVITVAVMGLFLALYVGLKHESVVGALILLGITAVGAYAVYLTNRKPR